MISTRLNTRQVRVLERVPEPIDRCEVITVLSGFLLRQRQLRRNGISIGLELIAFNWVVINARALGSGPV